MIPEPVIRRHGDYLITAEYLGARSSAVLGAYGWNLCWRDRRRRLQWLSVPSRAEAERAVHAAVTGGVA